MSTTAIGAARSRDNGGTSNSWLLPAAGIGVALLLIVVGTLLGSRRDEQLPTAYGRRRGSDAGRSVNGTAVLADMFKDAGHRVTTLNRLSPRVEKYDVIVWFPNDFKPPTAEQREYLEQWLKTGFGRTVVYVGRDYNAEIDYWQRVLQEAPPELASDSLRRQAEARAAWEAERSQMPEKEYARWFTTRRDGKPLPYGQLGGPWASDLGTSKADFHLEGRLDLPIQSDMPPVTTGATAAETEALRRQLEPPEGIEVLLSVNGEPFVFRLTDDEWQDAEGQVLVVANGSFHLNYPLVNHEHRKLAGKLIDECGDNQRVAFIESGRGGPAIVKKETKSGGSSALEMLKVWPLNAILLHVIVLGIVLCLARSLIFGRPRELPTESNTDFGQHVEALGKLLARTKDRNYAQSRLQQYRQIAQRRSGRSHLRK
jgi:hypothetical protein